MVERAQTPGIQTGLESVRGSFRPYFRTRRLIQLLRRSERGTAVVEFAIVALPLFLIIFGILDFGRALNYYNDMTQLAGQGARAAAVNQNIDGTPADSTFQAKLAAENDSPELTNKVQVCIQSAPTSVGDPVTVTAKYRFHFNAIIASVPITLSSTQTERSEIATPSYTSGCSPATLP
jgi:Flp pilus assembly protein TadG